MKLRTLSPILSVLLMLSVPHTVQSKENSTLKDVGIGIAVVGAVGLVVGSIISAASSWFEVSNATLIADGQRMVGQFNRDYYFVGQKISNYFNIGNLASSYNWQEIMPNEKLLYDIAIYAQKAAEGKSWHTISSEAQSFLNNVVRHKDKISARIAKIASQKKLDVQDQEELKKLRSLEAKLGFISAEMNEMYQYLCMQHAHYFLMAWREWALYKKYAHEIALLDGSIRTTLHLDQAISGVISQNKRNTRYAYMKYYTDLVFELDTLRSIRAGITYDRYPERCAWTDRVIAILHQLATIVEPWYCYEYELYQKEEAERRRTELEREKIRLLHEQNEAIRQHNRELERQRHQREIETTVATAALINGLINGPRVEERRTDVQVSIEVVS